MSSLPAFDVAISQFQAFMANQGITVEPLWVFREDVVELGRALYVRVSRPDDNARRVRAMYEETDALARGVEFAVLCTLGARPCCFISFAGADASRPRAGLKVTVPTAPPSARLAGSALVWRARKWRERRRPPGPLTRQVPARDALPSARLLRSPRRPHRAR